MMRFRTGGVSVLIVLLTATGSVREAKAQAPTIEESGLLPSGETAAPGGYQSLLGPMPGGGGILGMQPGKDEMLFGGRVGTSMPRVPASVTMPGGTYQGPPTRTAIAAPQPQPVPQPPFYGTLDVGEGPEDQGPPNGLTLDQAIEMYVNQNLALRALALELPQAEADVITANLRANPILYGDSQLVPYEKFSRQRPGGPTQYDLNMSHPIDYSHKRQARTKYATDSLRVMELQYRDAVRRGIGDLYLAYVDVLAARRTVEYSRVNAKGVDELLRSTRLLFQRAQAPSADVDQAQAESEAAAVSLADAEEMLLQRKRDLAGMLYLPAADADRLELRGALEQVGPQLPPDEELYRLALECRPDIAAFRKGVTAAQSAYHLARANRFADAYLLYQPYTYQDNSPYGVKSATSWAVGLTFPFPLYNRNQGNIERARINILQSQVQLSQQERQIITEVQKAIYEYRISAQNVVKIRDRVLPASKRAINSRGELFREGEATIFEYLTQRRNYNDKAKAYLDASARHRRAMLSLNTAVGQRILP
jgi:outer membrane protein, heavy metal efflux system